MCGGMLGQPSRAESSDTRPRISFGTIFRNYERRRRTEFWVRACALAVATLQSRMLALLSASRRSASGLRKDEIVFVHDHQLFGVRAAERELQFRRLLARRARNIQRAQARQ